MRILMGILMRILIGILMMDSMGWPYDSSDCLLFYFRNVGLLFHWSDLFMLDGFKTSYVSGLTLLLVLFFLVSFRNDRLDVCGQPPLCWMGSILPLSLVSSVLVSFRKVGLGVTGQPPSCWIGSRPFYIWSLPFMSVLEIIDWLSLVSLTNGILCEDFLCLWSSLVSLSPF